MWTRRTAHDDETSAHGTPPTMGVAQLGSNAPLPPRQLHNWGPPPTNMMTATEGFVASTPTTARSPGGLPPALQRRLASTQQQQQQPSHNFSAAAPPKQPLPPRSAATWQPSPPAQEKPEVEHYIDDDDEQDDDDGGALTTTINLVTSAASALFQRATAVAPSPKAPLQQQTTYNQNMQPELQPHAPAELSPPSSMLNSFDADDADPQKDPASQPRPPVVESAKSDTTRAFFPSGPSNSFAKSPSNSTTTMPSSHENNPPPVGVAPAGGAAMSTAATGPRRQFPTPPQPPSTHHRSFLQRPPPAIRSSPRQHSKPKFKLPPPVPSGLKKLPSLPTTTSPPVAPSLVTTTPPTTEPPHESTTIQENHATKQTPDVAKTVLKPAVAIEENVTVSTTQLTTPTEPKNAAEIASPFPTKLAEAAKVAAAKAPPIGQQANRSPSVAGTTPTANRPLHMATAPGMGLLPPTAARAPPANIAPPPIVAPLVPLPPPEHTATETAAAPSIPVPQTTKVAETTRPPQVPQPSNVPKMAVPPMFNILATPVTTQATSKVSEAAAFPMAPPVPVFAPPTVVSAPPAGLPPTAYAPPSGPTLAVSAPPAGPPPPTNALPPQTYAPPVGPQPPTNAPPVGPPPPTNAPPVGPPPPTNAPPVGPPPPTNAPPVGPPPPTNAPPVGPPPPTNTHPTAPSPPMYAPPFGPPASTAARIAAPSRAPPNPETISVETFTPQVTATALPLATVPIAGPINNAQPVGDVTPLSLAPSAPMPPPRVENLPPSILVPPANVTPGQSSGQQVQQFLSRPAIPPATVLPVPLALLTPPTAPFQPPPPPGPKTATPSLAANDGGLAVFAQQHLPASHQNLDSMNNNIKSGDSPNVFVPARPLESHLLESRSIEEQVHPQLEPMQTPTSHPDEDAVEMTLSYDGTLTQPPEREVPGGESNGSALEDEVQHPASNDNDDEAEDDHWVQEWDASSGRSYYYNVLTQEVAWEIPSSRRIKTEEVPASQAVDELAVSSRVNSSDDSNEVEDVQRHQEEEQSATPESTLLPTTPDFEEEKAYENQSQLRDDWVEEFDAVSGRPYYFNVATLEASWDPPVALSPKSPAEQPESALGNVGLGAETSVEPKMEQKNGQEGMTETNESDVPESTWSGERSDEAHYLLQDSWNQDSSSDNADHVSSETEGTSSHKPEAIELNESGPLDGVGAPDWNEQDQVPETARGNEADDSLPMGWIELQDPSSGLTYYYNEETQLTTWERPLPTVLSETEPREEEKEALVSSDGYIEAVEKEANETQVDPVSRQLNQAGIAPLQSAELPEGWVEDFDSTSERTYYFNTATNEASWDRPVRTSDGEKQPVSSPSNREAEDGNDNLSKTMNSPAGLGLESQAVRDEDVSVLPPGWVEEVDEVSGRSYYYFVDDPVHTRSWARPAEPEFPEHLATLFEEREEAESSPLPEGWVESIDPSAGRSFFYLAEDKIRTSTWRRPSRAKVEMPKLEQLEEEDGGEMPPAAKEVTGVPEESLGKGVAVEDGAFTQAHDDDALTSTYPETDEDGHARGEMSDETERLPDGWTKHVDPTSGLTFYFNASENRTTWDPPTTPLESQNMTIGMTKRNDSPTEKDKVIAAQPEQDMPRVEDQVQSDASPTDATIPDVTDNANTSLSEGDTISNDLPDGWEELMDETSGLKYYFNSHDGTTTWDRPMNEELAVSSSDNVDSMLNQVASHQKQPSPEEEVYVQQQNDESFIGSGMEDDRAPEETGGSNINVETTDLTEARLSGFVDSQAQSPELEVEQITTSKESQDTLTDDVDDAVEEESCLQGSLPLGWVEFTDPASGVPYYVFEADGTSTWERPLRLPEDKDSGDTVFSEPAESAEPLQMSGTAEGDTISNVHGLQDEFQLVAEVQAGANENSDEGALPPGWVELLDSTSGNPYYFHEADNVAVWERPKSSVEGKNELLASDGKLDLPEPTVEQRTSGGNFEIVETSSNSKPFAESNDVLNSNAVECTLQDQPEQGTSLDDNHDLQELPEGWVEVEDPSSGRPYYFCELDGSTTWEKPRAKGQQLPEPEINTTVEEDVVSLEDNATARHHDELSGSTTCKEQQPDGFTGVKEAESLPEGWVEIVEPTSGLPYYYNEEQNITTWDKPVTLDGSQKVEGSNMPSETPSDEGKPATHDEVSTNALPPGWVELNDPSSGQTYYFNEKEGLSTWVRPIFDAGSKELIYDDGTFTRLVAHSFATFGFSGSICTWSKSHGSIVALHRCHDVAPFEDVANVERTKRNYGVDGPLNSCEETLVMQYLEGRVRDKPEDLLWSLILIAAKSKGRLRSDEGARDPSGPEAAIVKLLLDDTCNDSVTTNGGSSLGLQQGVNGSKSSLEKVQSLLLRGQREEAVHEALASHNYAIALLVASMCDRESYQRAVKEFADNALTVGSPLHTISLLFSAQLQPLAEKAVEGSLANSSIWGHGADELRKTWKYHLAAIISNRTAGWDKIVLTLGDRLLELGEVKEAHFCYMVCGCPLSSPSHPSSRMAIVGCDHLVPMDVALMTTEGIDAYERSEAYEWAKRLGNRHAAIQSLQPFKFIYAGLLCDIGFKTTADRYLQSIRQCAALSPSNGKGNGNPSPFALFSDRAAFATTFDAFESRLHGQITPVESESDSTMQAVFPSNTVDTLSPSPDKAPFNLEFVPSDDDITFHSAKSNPLEITSISPFENQITWNTGLESKADVSSERMTGPAQDNDRATVPIDPKEGTGPRRNGKSKAASSDKVKASTSTKASRGTIRSKKAAADGPTKKSPSDKAQREPDKREKKSRTVAERSISKNKNGLTSTPSTLSPHPAVTLSEETELSPLKGRSLTASNQPTDDSSQTQGFPNSVVGKGLPKSLSIDTHEINHTNEVAQVTPASAPLPSRKEPPMSAPAVMTASNSKKQSKPPAAPSSEKKGRLWGGLGIINETMTRLLNRDAKTADLGEGMQAYYDEKRKVWVFPGEDPDEKTKPLPPPPTTPLAPEASGSRQPETPSSYDPLAAMMAPPKRTPASLPRNAGTRVSSAPGTFSMASPPGGGGAPPQFAVFQPKPAASTSE